MPKSCTIRTIARPIRDSHLLRWPSRRGGSRMHRRFIPLLVILIAVASLSASGRSQSAETMLEGARRLEVVDGDLKGAIKQYQAVVDRFSRTDRSAAARALLLMAEAYQKVSDAE